MILSHRIEIDTTFKQRRYFTQAVGCARFVWNQALAEWNRQYEAGGKPSGMQLKKEFNAAKYELYPWMKDVHRDAHAAPFANLDKAFRSFFKGISKRPTFKKKGKCRDSFAVANDQFRMDGNRVRLPRIGWVNLRESLRFTGKIMGAVVSRTADRWFISIQVDVGDYSKQRVGDEIVGVDLGITTAATLSTGEKIAGPRPLKAAQKKLRRLQRSFARKQKGSNRREKLKLAIAKLHARIKNIRNDFIHKLTYRLCKNHAAIGIENLNAAGMVKNRKLAKHVSDVAFGEFGRQMSYKSLIFGNRLEVADRWYPSSKTCNSCGEIKEKLSLSHRSFRCEGCGNVADRDVNAAKNLESLCAVGLTAPARGPEGSGSSDFSRAKPRRGEARTKPCPQLDTI